jgi:hypothetical protein
MTTTSKEEQSVGLQIKFPEPILDGKIIPLWLIVFDQDPTKAYIHTSKNKVMASVEGAIRGTYGEEADLLVPSVLKQIDKTWGQSFISLKCPPSLDLFVHRLEIDKHNPICKVLLECYGSLPHGLLRTKIAKLFIDAV